MGRGHSGAKAALALTLCAVFALQPVLVACGGQDSTSVGNGLPSGPQAFDDESYAELATDGDSLWLAVSGYRRDGSFGLKVFERDGSDWLRLPRPPGPVSGDLPISFVTRNGERGGDAPCLGYSLGVERTPVVACLDGETWGRQDLPIRSGAQLIQLDSKGQSLQTLISETQAGETWVRLWRQIRGEWVATPRVPAGRAVAQLAIQEPGSSAPPAIGLATQERGAEHFAYALRGRSWRLVKPVVKGVGAGPLLGGPLLLRGRVLYPVNQADSEPWSFSVQSARIGASRTKLIPLSADAGNAQGELSLAAGRIWATWQEDAPLSDGQFRATIYAAELSPSGQILRKVRLWQGRSIGPGSVQILPFQGETIALYMRSSSNARGLRATVKTLR